MKAFMDKDFVLETATAQHLFHDYAEKLPLVDYHCHLNPREIYEDRRFNDLAEVWLGGQNPDGTYTVQLKICDQQADQLNVEVLAMTRRQCELLEDNFRRRAESLYHELLLLLSGGGTVE